MSKALRDGLISKALSLVNSKGWTEFALQQAVLEHSLSPVMSRQLATRAIFPNGEYELVEHVLARHFNDLNERFETGEFSVLSKEAQVVALLKASLEYKAPYIRRWDEAMRLALDNPSTSGPLLWAQWTLISKPLELHSSLPRSSLTALVGHLQSNAEQFMQGDTSLGFEQTWGFLESAAATTLSWETSLETAINYSELLSKTVYRLVEAALPEPAEHINPMPR